MGASISRLLNKKGWTGKELGRIEIANMVKLFADSKAGVIDPEPIVPIEKLRQMVSALSTPQRMEYNGYTSIHNWIVNKYNMAQLNQLRVSWAVGHLQTLLSSSLMSYRVYEYISRLPAIMTKEQYERRKKERAEYWTKSKGSMKFFDLFLYATAYYINLLEKQPDKANPLKAIKKLYEKQPLTNKKLLSKWEECYNYTKGHYETEDGKRSDKLTPEEWKAAITTDYYKKEVDGSYDTHALALAALHSVFAGEFSSLFLKIQGGELYGKGEKPFELAELTAEQLKKSIVPLKWISDPVQRTKWEFIEDASYASENCYSDMYQHEITDDTTDKEFLDAVAPFVEEFSELVEVICKDIYKTCCNGKPVMAKKPLLKWGDPFIKEAEMYSKNYYGFRDYCTGYYVLFNDNERACSNGIAIMTEDTPKDSYTDKNGNYKEPNLPIEILTIDMLLDKPDARLGSRLQDDEGKLKEKIKKYRAYLVESIYFLIGYNKALELIEEMYDLDLAIFKPDFEEVQREINIFMGSKTLLWHTIERAESIIGNERADQLLAVLDTLFAGVSISKINVMTPERIQQAKEYMAGFDAFIRPEIGDRFYRLLCISSYDYQTKVVGV